MTTNQYRRQWLRWHRIYERQAYYILRRAMMKSLRKIPINDLTEENYEGIIKQSIDSQFFYLAYVELYTDIGLKHGKRVLKDIEKQTKNAFTDTFRQEVAKFLFNYGGERITSVSTTLAEYIIKEIALLRDEGLTISEVVSKILKRRSLYRYQLLRIARTETTAAAGYASNAASSASGIVLEKVWVSAQDSRTRRTPKDQYDHYDMNLVRVDDGQPFKVKKKTGGFEFIDFPGDPQASAGNVINCRCNVIKVGKRDADGNVIRRF